MIDDWTNTTPYPKIEYPVRTEGYEGAPTADGSFRYLGAKSRRHPALLAIQPPLQRGLRGADRAGHPSFPHERQRAPRPARPQRSPSHTISPRGRTERGTPWPPPRRKIQAISLHLSPRGCRVAPSPCYRARLSDSVQAACALLKTTPHARGDPVLLLLAQSRLLNS